MKRYYIILLLLLSASASAQIGYFRNGALTTFRRDSTFRVDLDTAHSPIKAWIKTVGDSLGYAGKDTITFRASGAFNAVDTASVTYISPWHSVSQAGYGVMVLAHATGDWKPICIAITHEFDSSGLKYGRRDTIVYNVGAIIPRGSLVYVSYTPASSFGGPSDPQSCRAAQEVGIYYRTQNGSITNPASDCVQVPMILGWAGRQFGMGLEDDHWLTVTVTLAQE